MKSVEKIEASLRAQLFGQDAAIQAIIPIIETFAVKLLPGGRPAATFLLLGPTGTGKTKTVEALASALLDNPKAVLQINCAEFQHSHEIAKLVGSPPGYLGHRETNPMLSQAEINKHHTEEVKLGLVLFDEIEKASDALWNLLLGILDKAQLTLGSNVKVDFTQTFIFMTSNLGAQQMQDLVTPRMGFVGAHDERELSTRRSNIGINAARRKFSPEFMNRIDAVVTYEPLSADALRQILDAEIDAIASLIHRARGPMESFYLIVADTAKDYLLKRGTSQRYGARELKRLLQRELVQPLARKISRDEIFRGGVVYVTADDNGLVLTPRMSANFLGSAV